MALRRFLLAPILVVFGACSADRGTPTQAEGAADSGGSSGSQRTTTDSLNSSRGGASNAGKVHSPDTNSSSPSASDGDADAGGAGGAGNTLEDPSCEVDDTCTSDCHDTQATCGVISTGVACEFEGFADATAPVACGERVIVGTACCGGCGCVPVELFFDGENCWQGIPTCQLPEFTNRLFAPHPTTEPNPSFVPDGPFYLGNGGIGGSGMTGGNTGGTGAGGTSSGNSAGGANDCVDGDCGEGGANHDDTGSGGDASAGGSEASP